MYVTVCACVSLYSLLVHTCIQVTDAFTQNRAFAQLKLPRPGEADSHLG